MVKKYFQFRGFAYQHRRETSQPLKKRIVVDSHGVVETRRLGRRLGQALGPGSVVALTGELGSGKTQFVKGLARGLGAANNAHVSSPSFVVINEYPGEVPLYHVDLFRLAEESEIEDLGLEEYIYGDGVTAIEWAERAASILPPDHIWIEIQWKGPHTRRLIAKTAGKRHVEALQALCNRDKGSSS